MNEITKINLQKLENEFSFITLENKFITIQCKFCNKIVTKKEWEFNYIMKRRGNIGCSKSCKERRKAATCIAKYGFNTALKSPDVIQKRKETNQKLYGVNCSWQREDVKEKIKNTRLEKYGVEYILQSPAVKQKFKNTCIERYGVDSFSKTNEFKNSIKIKNEQTIKKIYDTKKRNNSLASSEVEKEFCDLIQDVHPTAKFHYKDERYPFACDIYIPEQDLFIELQFHWTHGKMLFNPNDKICVEKLLKWNEKAKTSKYFQNAINTWTVRDVKKRAIAKENGLNYIEVFENKTIGANSWQF